MPLSLYEAALAGCGLVVSETVSVREEIKPFVSRVNPRNPARMRALIEEAMGLDRRDGLRKAALRLPDWSEVGERIRGIYREVLG
jgi:hypothetical protein